MVERAIDDVILGEYPTSDEALTAAEADWAANLEGTPMWSTVDNIEWVDETFTYSVMPTDQHEYMIDMDRMFLMEEADRD